MELKKKSISVHTVTTIVLAVLLAISLMLGLSGAWFTDKATGNGDVQFGQVKVGDSITVTVPANIVPTQKIEVADAKYEGVAAYYRITVGINEATYVPASGGPTAEELNAILGKATAYGAIESTWNAGTTSYDQVDVAMEDIEIPNTVGNNFQNVVCQLVVTLDVIQQEGTAATTPTDTAGWEAVFAKCTDFANGTPNA